MRRRRTAEPVGTGVTGAGTGLGRALVQRLAERGDLPLLVGLDRPAAVLDGVEWRTADVLAAGLARHLAGLRTVVHLAVSYDTAEDAVRRRARTVQGTAALLEAARTAGVTRVVVVTSLDVHASPPPGSPVPSPEDQPLRADPDSALTGDLLEVERLADHATRTGLEVLVLRPAPVVGDGLGPGLDGALLHSLSGPRLLAVRGVEPLWQVCHSDDLLSALELAATSDLSGAAAVASAGWLTQREVERLSGQRRVELPASVALSTAERLHRTGVTQGSPAELDRLLSPLVVEPRRLLDAGWTPTWTAQAALAAHVASRPATGGRAGAYTAAGAGATVALVGTAALVRRARRRRGR
jgi:nucleoside-diphosphate-sugar epimerase